MQCKMNLGPVPTGKAGVRGQQYGIAVAHPLTLAASLAPILAMTSTAQARPVVEPGHTAHVPSELFVLGVPPVRQVPLPRSPSQQQARTATGKCPPRPVHPNPTAAQNQLGLCTNLKAMAWSVDPGPSSSVQATTITPNKDCHRNPKMHPTLPGRSAQAEQEWAGPMNPVSLDESMTSSSVEAPIVPRSLIRQASMKVSLSREPVSCAQMWCLTPSSTRKIPTRPTPWEGHQRGHCHRSAAARHRSPHE